MNHQNKPDQVLKEIGIAIVIQMVLFVIIFTLSFGILGYVISQFIKTTDYLRVMLIGVYALNGTAIGISSITRKKFAVFCIRGFLVLVIITFTTALPELLKMSL